MHPISDSDSVNVSSTDNIPLGCTASDVFMAESGDPHAVIGSKGPSLATMNRQDYSSMRMWQLQRTCSSPASTWRFSTTVDIIPTSMFSGESCSVGAHERSCEVSAELRAKFCDRQTEPCDHQSELCDHHLATRDHQPSPPLAVRLRLCQSCEPVERSTISNTTQAQKD